MDAREWETSHVFRSSSKRPWESYSTPREALNPWNGTRLPPIEPVPYTQSLPPRRPETTDAGNNYHYESNSPRSSTPKKAKYDGNDSSDNSFWDKQNSQSTVTSISTPKSAFTPTYRANREFRSPYDPPTAQGNTISGSANAQDTSLCQRCKRDTRQQNAERLGESESCEICCRNPDLILVTQATAAGLIQLVDTLRTGKSSKQRSFNPSAEQDFLKSFGYPPISEFGLKSSLDWMLGKLNQINQLTDRLFEIGPPVEHLQRNNLSGGPGMKDGLNDEMQRRYTSEADAEPKKMDGAPPMRADLSRRSPIVGRASNEEYPLMNPQSSYSSGAPSTMNPPPAPNRQLLSPPGRQLPSPTSVNFPSPGAASYGSNISANITPLSSSQQSTVGNALPSLTGGLSGDSAIQAHSAALQHEVSVQKIALSSLQGEHDKLLAAFSRSQTRSSALEKKHAVSDGEIINLTEEKLRLQQQVMELEKDVEDLTRSRDEFRQAAVQESAQYIEIVNRATRLEKISGEERMAWNLAKRALEQEIDLLKARQGEVVGSIDATMKVEGGDADPAMRKQPATDHGGLLEEVRRLRSRCTKAEDALRAVRADTERIVGSLSMAGRGIMERVDNILIVDASDL